MGLAASQARLLTLTARLADNELRSQTINNAKMRLSTESSQASEDYINALNEAQLQFANYTEDGSAQTQSLTYNALTAYSSYNNQYGLVDSSNNILVSEKEADLYKKAGGDLNTYLESHGLKYTTTYFDEVGAMTNPTFPDPYDVITVDTLEEMYNRYNASENSVAVQQFEDDYALFQQYSQKAKNEVANVYTNIMYGYTNNTTTTFQDLGNDRHSWKTLFGTPNGTLYKYATNFIEKYKTSVTDTTELDKKIAEICNGTTLNGGTLAVNGKNVTVSVAGTYDPDSDPNNGNSINSPLILTDHIQLSYDGTNWSAELGYYDEKNKWNQWTNGTVDDNYKYNLSGTNTASTLQGLLSQLTLTIEKLDSSGASQGKETYKNFKLDDTNSNNYYDTNESITCDYTTTIESDILNHIDDAKYNIKNTIFSYLDIIDFGEVITDEYEKSSDKSSKLKELGFKNLSEYNEMKTAIEDYQTIKDEYVGLIFGTSSTGLSELGKFILQHAMAEDLSYKTDADGEPVRLELSSLQDIDAILEIVQAIKNKNAAPSTDPGNNVPYIRTKDGKTYSGTIPNDTDLEVFPTKNFETVIEYSLIDEMLDEYGEPCYTWVDENDTNNTGDAYSKATWYTNLFNRMKQGYKELENGLANSSEWIKYAFESGIVTMEQVNSNSEWSSLSYSDCTKITEDYDQNAVTKAEAEYNRAMNDIESKDSAYDIQLKNIDTEHTSIQTEIDVVKNVISKNIERTMKFSQSA